MSRIRSFVRLLLLLSFSLSFTLSSKVSDPSLEADLGALSVEPVPEDPIFSVTPAAQTSTSSSTTESPVATGADQDEAEESTVETITVIPETGPQSRVDSSDSDDIASSSEAGSSAASSSSEQPVSASSLPPESASSEASEAEGKAKELTSENSKVTDDAPPETVVRPEDKDESKEVIESSSDASSTATSQVTSEASKEEAASAGTSGISSESPPDTGTANVTASTKPVSTTASSNASESLNVHSSTTESSEDSSSSGPSSLSTEASFNGTSEQTPDASPSPVSMSESGSSTESSPVPDVSPSSESVSEKSPSSNTSSVTPNSSSLSACSSSATGANKEGCISVNQTSDCKTSEFGCCPDMKTPATGTEGAGCTCLHSPFGCCSDNVTAATGSKQEGCHCNNTILGCCPDGKTAASGSEGAGCGCNASLHGCCPDGKTAARGVNQTGCPCESLPHNCCPDRLTPATGSNNEGCPCSTMPFGCCPNSTEAAKGPLFDGCNCAETPYGCCPNGKSVAIGPKFEGCPDGTPLDTRLSAQACSLPKERGTCRNYTVKWTYDMTYGGCIRFWYGGCEGNANRFQSQEECERVCVSPEGSEACLLPKVEGPCQGTYPSFFFSSETRTCQDFNYGGCLGNKNRFDTLEACTQLCLSTPSKDPCEQPVIQGPCRGFNARWYYSKQDGRCRSFIYGGCLKNDNNFESEAACNAKCGSTEPRELCILPKAEGPCLGQYPRWHYDYLDKSCKEFTYTGCEGNRNRFVDKFSCERTCNQTQVVVNTDVCSLPKSEGPCRGAMLRWHFNPQSKRCDQFYYGGCQGNANKFESRIACERACAPAAEVNVCLQKLDPGMCSNKRSFYNLDERWFYNQSDQVCHRFYYTGCAGNGNNFQSLDECQQRCGRPTAPPEPIVPTPSVGEFKIEYCSEPQDHGPCPSNDIMWWYDSRDGVCKEFYYGGCSGNNNRFKNRKECEMKCWNSQDICKLKKVRGPCTGKFVQWHYDPVSDQCLSFSYSGCSGNANRFSQKESCETQCKINQGSAVVIPFPTPPERENGVIPNGVTSHEKPSPGKMTDPSCMALLDVGTCRNYVPQYYYDANENVCRGFVYTGCGGNSNRFESRPECEARCVTSRGEDEPLTEAEKEIVCRLEANQGTCSETHARWFYDPASVTCVPFVYTGCGGNKNRFKAFETCIKFCQGVQAVNPAAIDVTDMDDTGNSNNINNKPVSNGKSAQPSGPYPYPVFTTPSSTTTVSTTTQRDLCKYECSDSQYFADCELIVQNQFCSNPYYAKFCCKSCHLSGLLDMEKVKEVIIGSQKGNFHVLNDGSRICFFENAIR